jgi:hypothetical protein
MVKAFLQCDDDLQANAILSPTEDFSHTCHSYSLLFFRSLRVNLMFA